MNAITGLFYKTPATSTAPAANAVQTQTTSKLFENATRAVGIAVIGGALCVAAHAAGHSQGADWEKVADLVAKAFVGATAVGVAAQTKDVVDVANPVVDSLVGGVTSVVSYTASGVGYLSNVTGTTWAVSTVWNKTCAAAKSSYDTVASFSPYAKKV